MELIWRASNSPIRALMWAALSPREARSAQTTSRAIAAYCLLISIPIPFLPERRQATMVLPVPAMGSRTVCPALVKNSTKLLARVSGNFAGWRSTPFLRGGGLCTNHDFWNFSHVLPSRSFKRLRKVFLQFCFMDLTSGDYIFPQVLTISDSLVSLFS